MKWRRLLGLLIVLSLGVAIWYFGFARKNRLQSDHGNITLFGNVDIRQVELSFQVAGQIQFMRVEEGDHVKPNMLVAQLDRTLFQESVKEDTAQVGSRTANLTLLLNGTRVEDIAQHRADVNQREADLVKAQTLLDKRSAVVCLGGVTKQDYDDALKDRDAAAAQLESARQILRKDINGPRKEDIWASRADVAAAKAALSQAKTQLSYTKLFAPSAGIIQTRVVEPGAVISPGQTVFALALDSPKWVWAYLEEADLGRVRAGMKADIFTDARPKKPYKAHIGYISPTAEFTPKNVETRQLRTALVYPIRLVVQDPDNILRQGMPVTVRLHTGIARMRRRLSYE